MTLFAQQSTVRNSFLFRRTSVESIDLAQPFVCHCLRITEAEIRETADALSAPTVRCVMKETGAGSGCTACHRRIRDLLADQCPPSSSPTCVIR